MINKNVLFAVTSLDVFLLLQVWMRCESVSGYCNDLRVYLGKHDDFKSKQLGERVVSHLCRPLKHKNHQIFFDRY